MTTYNKNWHQYNVIRTLFETKTLDGSAKVMVSTQLLWLRDQYFRQYITGRSNSSGGPTVQAIKDCLTDLRMRQPTHNPFADTPKKRKSVGRPLKRKGKYEVNYYAIIDCHPHGPFKHRDRAVLAAERKISHKSCTCCGETTAQRANRLSDESDVEKDS